MIFFLRSWEKIFSLLLVALLLLVGCGSPNPQVPPRGDHVSRYEYEVGNAAMESMAPEVISSNNHKYRQIIELAMQEATIEADHASTSTTPQSFKIGITSHHLPVAAGFIARFYQHMIATDSVSDTFVIIGPDHDEKCEQNVTVGLWPYDTAFGRLEIDRSIVEQLVASGIPEESPCLAWEHSLGVQTDFIRYNFPNAKIVPIVLSASVAASELEQLASALAPFEAEVTVIVSVDFNHYRTAAEANAFDDETERYIMVLNGLDLTVDNVDSPSSLQLAFLLAQRWDYTSPNVFERKNSFDILGDFENTTGYMNVAFE